MNKIYLCKCCKKGILKLSIPFNFLIKEVNQKKPNTTNIQTKPQKCRYAYKTLKKKQWYKLYYTFTHTFTLDKHNLVKYKHVDFP